ncbi:hypothetical protein L798_01029 [Zootermopsis nevadensis]|uniref:Argonaute linker 1 domain-containing protein n=1 Tax=Zootermopsis nevadensis TaxID=136037 RepID=A0A067QJT9_ZOONE|nr:hypothetical protein L798_01029 [Zootermopsis nevadensis]
MKGDLVTLVPETADGFRATVRVLRSLGSSLAKPREAIHALNIVLRSQSALSFVQVGRCFFTPTEPIVELGKGLEMWRGSFQTVTLGWKPFANVDVVQKRLR